MPFQFPTVSEIAYRIWRLRRLIAVTIFAPFAVLVILGFLGLNGIAGSTGGVIAVGLFLTVVVGGHAVVFPNANEETIALSGTFVGISLILAILPWSFFGVLLCLVLAIWAMALGQSKIMMWKSRSKPHQPVLKARVKVKTDVATARAMFPLRPGLERGQHRCGEADADGVFPVWYDIGIVDMFPGIADTDVLQDEIEAVLEEKGITKDNPEYAEFEADCRKELEEDADYPSFWGLIDEDEPEFQKTSIFTENEEGTREVATVMEHRFRSTRGGCEVTETDVPTAYARGLSLAIWLSDFQTDGLVHLRDILESVDTKALRGTHRWSLLTLTAKWFIGRQIDKANAAEG